MLVLWKGHLTDKSDDKVGLLNIILVRTGGICNLQNTRLCPWVGGDIEVWSWSAHYSETACTSIKTYVELLMKSHLKKIVFIEDAAFEFWQLLFAFLRRLNPLNHYLIVCWELKFYLQRVSIDRAIMQRPWQRLFKKPAQPHQTHQKVKSDFGLNYQTSVNRNHIKIRNHGRHRRLASFESRTRGTTYGLFRNFVIWRQKTSSMSYMNSLFHFPGLPTISCASTRKRFFRHFKEVKFQINWMEDIHQE